MRELPFPAGRRWPSISVVVCSYNGAATIADCLRRACSALDYPDYEVIVIDDGSTDATARIARRVRRARDQHAEPRPERGPQPRTHGGPRRDRRLHRRRRAARPALADLPRRHLPPDRRTSASAGPTSPPRATVPSPTAWPTRRAAPCTCSCRTGWPSTFPAATWRSAARPSRPSAASIPASARPATTSTSAGASRRAAGRSASTPGAMVWHHRRNSLRAYWRQQVGYGRAEALLEQKWPEKYNAAGHVAWAGRLYGKGLAETLGWRPGRIYHGVWGSALFQRMYDRAPGTLASLPLMPEWYLCVLVLAVLGGLGAVWAPLRLVWPLLAAAVGLPVLQAARAARQAQFASAPATRRRPGAPGGAHRRPAPRPAGGAPGGTAPPRADALALRQRGAVRDPARAATARVERDVACRRRTGCARRRPALRTAGRRVARGSAWDRWDLEVSGGLLGGARVRMAVEEHGAGRQLIRFNAWPRWSCVDHRGPRRSSRCWPAWRPPGTRGFPAVVLAAGWMALLGSVLYEAGRALGCHAPDPDRPRGADPREARSRGHARPRRASARPGLQGQGARVTLGPCSWWPPRPSWSWSRGRSS